MNSIQVAEALYKLAKLMELHQDNPFKVKAIANAASSLEKMNCEINEQNYHELANIKGIGKNILEKIHELISTNNLLELEQLESNTPHAIMELLNIKGLGANKVYKLWKEFGIKNIEELLEWCKDDKLSKVKGFGKKTQETILENTHFYLENKNKLHLHHAFHIANRVLNYFQKHHIKLEITGELRRHCEIINQIEFITTQKIDHKHLDFVHLNFHKQIVIHYVTEQEYFYNLFKTTGSKDYLEEIMFYKLHKNNFLSEKAILKDLGINACEPYQREASNQFFYIDNYTACSKEIIQQKDFKGVIHCHTLYSDGLNSIEEMADYAIQNNYEYIVVSDHSQSAVYANGLKPNTVQQQFKEIEQLNHRFSSFKILKGIESDILANGDLDYKDDVLKQFDVVIASVHSGFNMTENEATERIIRAIENPYTKILGHLTGRLLLIRKGYPINHKKIIDACAANKVIIELNANAYRLDIDWRFIPYCMKKNVPIAINPDAHEKTAISDMHYGIMVAQKAGLEKEMCVNTWNYKQVLSYKHNLKT